MNYEADIVRIGAMALFDLKGKKDALIAWLGEDLPPFPEAANTGSSRADAELLYIGRDHWLLLAPLEKEAILETALRTSAAPSDISIVQVSDSQTFFDITGPDASQIMNRASPLDVDPVSFPAHGATYSEAFGLKALIVRRPNGFWLAVEQSFGDMIEDYLSRAQGAGSG